MYYVFGAAVLGWRNQMLWAQFYGERNYPEYEPHWWEAVPLVEPLPLFTFMINNKAPKLDNFQTGTEFDLYSPRLIQLFREAGIKFELFPVKLIDRKTKEPVELGYEIFHLLENGEGVDEEKSEILTESPYDTRRLVMREEVLRTPRPLFRDKKQMNLVFIHEDFKKQLDEVGITGCLYTPTDEYVTGELARQRSLERIVAKQAEREKKKNKKRP